MLSVVITAWNEAKNLPRAIASVRCLADEIVVVDTESNDNTSEIAKKLGCKVFKHKNMGIVEPVRNFSISKAKGNWILLLDADEEISETLAEKIRNAISNENADYYRIPRKSIIFGKWVKSSHWWPDYVYRLFKAGSISWEDTIHSIPFTKGTGIDFPKQEEFSIIHHHYDSVSQYVERMNRYTDKQVESILVKGYNFSWKDLLLKPIAEFINQYYARNGYREGVHGLALAGLQSFSELVLYLKLWQSDGFTDQQVALSEVGSVLVSKANEVTWWEKQVKIDTSNVIIRPVLKLLRRMGV
jgi:(heptosyl)LPS beta-1,4-glucosyltransferase